MAESAPTVRLGLDAAAAGSGGPLAGRRAGLLTHPAGRDHEGVATLERLRRHPDVDLVALFGPEHGVGGDAEAGVGVASGRDARSGLPVRSLYGATPTTRRPTPAMLADVDALVIDLQDAGARPYTYAGTVSLTLDAAADADVTVVILDRPNPLGGLAMEGPVLEPPYASFVGLHPLPLRHGLTIGELARLANAARTRPADLTVVPMRGWRRATLWRDTGLPWLPPSPNLRTPEAALAYAGTVLVEGTNLSEGRGTPHPFEWIGAPFVDGRALAEALGAHELPGVRFEPARAVPVSSKHAGERCGGVRLQVTDPAAFRPVETALTLLGTVRALHRDAFAFLPAEGTDPPFFDALAGNGWLREGLLAGTPVAELARRWRPDLERYAAAREAHLLYR